MLVVHVGSSIMVGLTETPWVAVVVVVIVSQVVCNGGVEVTIEKIGGSVIVEKTVTGEGVTVVVSWTMVTAVIRSVLVMVIVSCDRPCSTRQTLKERFEQKSKRFELFYSPNVDTKNKILIKANIFTLQNFARNWMEQICTMRNFRTQWQHQNTFIIDFIRCTLCRKLHSG